MDQHTTSQRWVIKLGTSVLTAGTSYLNSRRMLEITRQIAHLHDSDTEAIVVSSGAITAGREQLGNPDLGRNLPVRQMLAAVGQPRLMHAYADLFAIFDIDVAQILLTRGDFSNRQRYLNARDTLNALLDRRVIPIINENDTIGTDEIKLGDNDNLSALVANLIDADRLILLTDQPGLFTTDPGVDPNAQLISTVEEIDESLWGIAGGAGSTLGTGGMVTKLQAAQLATRSGTTVIIAQGSRPNVLVDLAGPTAREIGTWFMASGSHMESRKRWILSERVQGTLTVDAGASRILARGEASLLPVGVVGVDGQFERGVIVRVVGPDGEEIARGLVNYGAASLDKIKGRQSDEIAMLLGYTYGDEVIHRDHLVLV